MLDMQENGSKYWSEREQLLCRGSKKLQIQGARFPRNDAYLLNWRKVLVSQLNRCYSNSTI